MHTLDRQVTANFKTGLIEQDLEDENLFDEVLVHKLTKKTSKGLPTEAITVSTLAKTEIHD